MLGEGFSRRNRFIVSCALAFGMGVSMVPQWSKNALWPDPGLGANQSLQSVRTAVLLILDTGFCVGAIVAFVLNMIVPHEQSQPEVGAVMYYVILSQIMLREILCNEYLVSTCVCSGCLQPCLMCGSVSDIIDRVTEGWPQCVLNNTLLLLL
jgi:hypothetical protein